MEKIKFGSHKIVPIVTIRPYHRNPRKSSNYAEVKDSIKRYGMLQPILVDKAGVIVAGHSRYKACMELGMTEVPVVEAEINQADAKRLRIIDNKLTEKNEWSLDNLEIELREIGDFTLAKDFEIDLDSVGKSISDVTDNDLKSASETVSSTFESKEAKKRKIICPHCAETFLIDA